MRFSAKNENDLKFSKELSQLQSKTKWVSCHEEWGKHGFLYNAQEQVEPITKTDN